MAAQLKHSSFIALPEEDEPIRVYVTLSPLPPPSITAQRDYFASKINTFFLLTHLSDDSDESYRSVQRFFRSESAESSSAIDWLELDGFPA